MTCLSSFYISTQAEACATLLPQQRIRGGTGIDNVVNMRYSL